MNKIFHRQQHRGHGAEADKRTGQHGHEAADGAVDKREEGDTGVSGQRGAQQGLHAHHRQVDTQNRYEPC